jgi:hypothetical protein
MNKYLIEHFKKRNMNFFSDVFIVSKRSIYYSMGRKNEVGNSISTVDQYRKQLGLLYVEIDDVFNSLIL